MTLRKASGARIEQSGAWPFTTHRFYYNAQHCFVLGRRGFRALARERERGGVAAVGADGDRTLWWTTDGLYWADAAIAADDVALLVWDRTRRQDVRLQRLRTLRAREEQLAGARRERIPDEVRAFVWRRDEGRCVRCGAEDDLQFDHVIPVSRGGGRSAENVQILCGECNRQKGDAIV